MTTLEKVRAKVIEAVPGIVVNPHAQLIGHDHKVTYFEEKRPIRLSDVLVAIDEKTRHSTEIEGMHPLVWRTQKWEWVCANWNLRADSLDEQSEETIAFLAKILGV